MADIFIRTDPSKRAITLEMGDMFDKLLRDVVQEYEGKEGHGSSAIDALTPDLDAAELVVEEEEALLPSDGRLAELLGYTEEAPGVLVLEDITLFKEALPEELQDLVQNIQPIGAVPDSDKHISATHYAFSFEIYDPKTEQYLIPNPEMFGFIPDPEAEGFTKNTGDTPQQKKLMTMTGTGQIEEEYRFERISAPVQIVVERLSTPQGNSDFRFSFQMPGDYVPEELVQHLVPEKRVEEPQREVDPEVSSGLLKPKKKSLAEVMAEQAKEWGEDPAPEEAEGFSIARHVLNTALKQEYPYELQPGEEVDLRGLTKVSDIPPMVRATIQIPGDASTNWEDVARQITYLIEAPNKLLQARKMDVQSD